MSNAWWQGPTGGTYADCSSGGRCALFPPGLGLVRIFNRCWRNFSRVSHPLGCPLFGFEQLLHRHALVDMVFGARDLLTGNQEPHVREYQVLGTRSPSGVQRNAQSSRQCRYKPFESDPRLLAEILVILSPAALALANGFVVLNKLDGANVLHHGETELRFDSKSERCSVQNR